MLVRHMGFTFCLLWFFAHTMGSDSSYVYQVRHRLFTLVVISCRGRSGFLFDIAFSLHGPLGLSQSIENQEVIFQIQNISKGGLYLVDEKKHKSPLLTLLQPQYSHSIFLVFRGRGNTMLWYKMCLQSKDVNKAETPIRVSSFMSLLEGSNT